MRTLQPATARDLLKADPKEKKGYRDFSLEHLTAYSVYSPSSSLFVHPWSRRRPFSPKALSSAQSGCQRPKETGDGDDHICEIRRSVEPAFSDEPSPLTLLRGIIREFGRQADGFWNNFCSPIGKCFGDSVTEGLPIEFELPG